MDLQTEFPIEMAEQLPEKMEQVKVQNQQVYE
jgi:hypothetical protein